MYFPPLHPLSSGHISSCTIWQRVPNVIWEEGGMQAMSAEKSWVAVKFLWPEPAPQGKRNATTGLVSFHPSTSHPLETDDVCEQILLRSWGFGMLLGGQILPQTWQGQLWLGSLSESTEAPAIAAPRSSGACHFRGAALGCISVASWTFYLHWL